MPKDFFCPQTTFFKSMHHTGVYVFKEKKDSLLYIKEGNCRKPNFKIKSENNRTPLKYKTSDTPYDCISTNQ